MVRTLLKVAIAILVVHVAWRVGSAYWTYYRFEDALQQLAQFGERRTDRQLCDEMMDQAGNYGVPITAAAITIRRGTNPLFNCATGPSAVDPNAVATAAGQISVEARYVESVQVLPGYAYPWEFHPAVKAWLRPF